MSAIKRPITPGPDSDAVEVQADKKMRDEDEDKTEENEEEEGEDEGDDEDEDGDKDAGSREEATKKERGGKGNATRWQYDSVNERWRHAHSGWQRLAGCLRRAACCGLG
jgi:hypothetical protein